MQKKEQDRALQTPAEANRDKHMNYLATDEENTNDTGDEENNATDEKDVDDVNKAAGESNRNKHDADSGNDSTNQMLQQENLIDPGNEHNHLRHSHKEDERREKLDADAGSDATGSTGPKPQ
jgi:hypothetical protein